ncbi:hypothetical protein [Sphingomonas sp. CFBP 8760]|uniref:hypothetical protein n=1 Tax=Sphingomonas sp. CFBP 8760 TaxID=2775282 RepID=UPI0017848DE6|nr:hypothetical protein [Sphingomonas sp. CFBP 8760]MBD8546793.1 hypothetical protein [Sphingomonas sp. CFBP 8760]
MKILALDGHDAAGKTSLARGLAHAVGARYARPFGGEPGRRLITAYQADRPEDVLAIGHKAILAQLDAAAPDERLIFDRGWLTVATLVPHDLFAKTWDLWLPTALLWCDEATTRARLELRPFDDDEPEDWHAHFLAAYRDRFSLRPGATLRTDQLSEVACLVELRRLFDASEDFPVQERATR